MGIYAGLLALRHPAPNKQQQPPADQAHTPTPTPTAPTVTTVTAGKEKGAAAGEQGVGAAVAVVAGGSPRAAEERKMMLTLTAAAPTAAQEKEEEGEKGGGGEGREPMPWPACFLGCFPLPPALAASRCGRALLLPLSTKPPATQRDWARVATWQGVGALLFTLGIAAADSYLAVRTRGRVVLRGHVWLQVRFCFCLFNVGGCPYACLSACLPPLHLLHPVSHSHSTTNTPKKQGLVPMVQLNILVALTRDGRLSLASRALGTSLAQWLGKVSMDVYLVHWPIIAYTALALHGPRRFETLLDCYGAVDARKEDPAHYDTCVEAMAAAKRFPPWGILIILPLALAAGELLRRYVNEPARRLLRARGPRQQQERQQEQVTATKSAAGE